MKELINKLQVSYHSLIDPFIEEPLSAVVHPPYDAAWPLVVLKLQLLYVALQDAAVGFASSFLVAGVISMDGGAGYPKTHLDLFYSMGGSSHVVVGV